MSTTAREGDEVVLRFKAGSESLGFSRFLLGAADAFAAGYIPPTNPHHVGNIAVAAEQVRTLADNIRKSST